MGILGAKMGPWVQNLLLPQPSFLSCKVEKGPCQGGSELQGQRLSVPLETAVMEDLFHSWLVQVFQLTGYLAQRCYDRKEVAGEISEPSPPPSLHLHPTARVLPWREDPRENFQEMVLASLQAFPVSPDAAKAGNAESLWPPLSIPAPPPASSGTNLGVPWERK